MSCGSRAYLPKLGVRTLARSLLCLFSSRRVSPNESRFEAGSLGQAFPQGEPNQRLAAIDGRPQGSIPLERGHGRDIPPLPNLSDHTSEHPSITNLPPASAPGGGLLFGASETPPFPNYRFNPINRFRGNDRFLLILPQDPCFRRPKYLPPNRSYASSAQPASASGEGVGRTASRVCLLPLGKGVRS